jgi:hypothetical protein
MNTKRLPNGDIKVWFDMEEDFIIINKDEPLIDSVINIKLTQKKNEETFMAEIKTEGFEGIYLLLRIFVSNLQKQIDALDLSELDLIIMEFNSIFSTDFGCINNPNGGYYVMGPQFDSYKEFRRSCFCSFLLRFYICRVNLLRNAADNPIIKVLNDFVMAKENDCMKIYLELCYTRKFEYGITM